MRVVLACGAGMSADSGLRTYRGPSGLWTLLDGQDPREVMNGAAYHERPSELWARHHAAALWQASITPHAGYRAALAWPVELFVVTSNVDGLWRRAGLPPEALHEVHGSAHWVQCRDRCGVEPWPRTPDLASSDIPTCPGCGGVARLNIVLFRDRDFDPARRSVSAAAFAAFVAEGVDLVVEVGAGTVLRTIRTLAERTALSCGADLLRVNLDDWAVSDHPGWVGLEGHAAEVLPSLTVGPGGSC